MRILIVEDEVRLAQALGQIMTEQKYQVDLVYDGADGLDYALTGQYDVVVLDGMLPKLDGLDVVRSLRRHHVSTPVLMLTARDEQGDKISGLDHGADDYVTKPFDPQELLARIRALTRRQGDILPDELTVGDLTLNSGTHTLCRGGKTVRLGFKEYQVIHMLMSRPKGVVPKEDILLNLWGCESEAEDNNVEVYISFLRKKMAFLGSETAISTVRKVGYHLEVPHD